LTGQPDLTNYHASVGFYYDSSEPPPSDAKPPGCLDALIITRAVFGVLIWPMLALVLVMVDAAIIFIAFTIHPALALIPLAVTAAGLWLFAKWEQRRIRPPGL
jgi:hypothetical protein